MTIRDAREVTPEWLTGVLRAAGAITNERVTGVSLRANEAFNSAISHLEVTYDRDRESEREGVRGGEGTRGRDGGSGPGSAGEGSGVALAPRELLLKLNREGWGEAEVGVYELAQAEGRRVPGMVPCFDAEFDPETGESHCLLLDLSGTHATPVTRRQVLALEGMPDEWQLHAMVDTLAAFHAHWWGHPAAGAGVLKPPSTMSTPEARAKRAGERATQLERFLSAVGTTVPAETVRLCERTAEALPALWERTYGQRFEEGRQLTLTNGDCYFAQFLCPMKESGSGASEEATYLVDFQEASLYLPAEDLVFMFATFWTRAQRREGERERRLIERYLRRLEEKGVTDYPLDVLMADYRLSIIYMLFRTIWDQTSGASEAYWRPKLECVVASYRDHECESLLNG